MFKTHTHTKRETNHLKGEFWIQGTSKHLNQTKFEFQNFRRKIIFSLPGIGMRKISLEKMLPQFLYKYCTVSICCFFLLAESE